MVKGYGMEEPLFVILVTFLVLGWAACLLRAWVKIVVIRKVTADDYLMLSGIIFYTGYSASALYGVTHGIGSLGQGLTLEEASVGLRAWWLCETLYAPVTLSVRTSVAVFLLQIAVQRVHRRIIIGVIVAFWIVTIPLFFVIVFQCRPISYFWMQPFPTVPRGTCMDGRVIFLVSVVHSAISACSDWALGILPIFMLWKVRLNKRTKLTLSALLSMGIFAGIALVVRIIYVRPFDVSVNFLYETLNVANWSILEPSVCIIAGCLATFRPLFSRFGWASIAKSTRKTPARYRQTRSRSRSKSNHGIGYVLGPGRMSGQRVYSNSSLRTYGLLRAQKPVEDEPCNEYELMVKMERGKGIFSSAAYEDESQGDKHASRSESRDEANDGIAAAGRSQIRQSMASYASVDSSQSVRFSSLSSVTTPYRSQKNPNRLSQWHDSPSQQPSGAFRGPSSPSSSCPLAPRSPPPPPPPPQSPSPCHILVNKSTRVEYKTSPPSAATMPSLPTAAMIPEMPEGARGATTNLIVGDEAPEDVTFHGDHSVKISGPSPTL